MIVAPEHMDRWSRHERLYRYLLSLGLVVHPIFADGERARIDHLRVSVDLPKAADICSGLDAEGDVVAPVQGAEIGEAVGTAERVGNNVVDFPPVI